MIIDFYQSVSLVSTNFREIIVLIFFLTSTFFNRFFSYYAGFESLIQNVGSVQNVIQWLQLCFQGCLAQSQGSRQISPRSLLLRWSFVASQIMRDLTLRSAPAFGSYQIFGLFFEELLSMQVSDDLELNNSKIVQR